MLYVSTVAILDGRHPYCCNIYCSKNDGNLCFSLFFLRKKAKEFEYKFLRYQAQILKNWNTKAMNSRVLNASQWPALKPFLQSNYLLHSIFPIRSTPHTYFYWQAGHFKIHWSWKKDHAECKRHSPLISNPLKELDPPDSLCSHTQATLQVGGAGRDQLGKERFPSSWFKKKQWLQRTLETRAWMSRNQLQRQDKVPPQTNTRQHQELRGMFCRSVPGDSSLTRYLGSFTCTPPTATPRALAEHPSAALALFGSQVNRFLTNC